MPEPPNMARRGPDLSEHYEFVEKIGDLISGQRALRETGQVIRVYKIPDREAMRAVPEMREAEFGRIGWGPDGYYEEESERAIVPQGDAHEKVDFLASIRDLVEGKRRELAVEANRNHTRSSAKPGGKRGQMLDMYDDLLGQIEHEHYRQQRKVEG